MRRTLTRAGTQGPKPIRWPWRAQRRAPGAASGLSTDSVRPGHRGESRGTRCPCTRQAGSPGIVQVEKRVEVLQGPCKVPSRMDLGGSGTKRTVQDGFTHFP